jgi:hypothetical protein
MDADLDLLLRTVFLTADDRLPERQRKRCPEDHGRGARHPVRRAGDHGNPVRSPVPRDRQQTPAPPAPELPKQPGYFKRRSTAGRHRGLRPVYQPFPPLPGNQTARTARPGRHPASIGTVDARSSGRTRPQAAPGTHPTADRIDLLDPQRAPYPPAPPRPHTRISRLGTPHQASTVTNVSTPAACFGRPASSRSWWRRLLRRPAICSRRTARPLCGQRPLLGALELLVAEDPAVPEDLELGHVVVW